MARKPRTSVHHSRAKPRYYALRMRLYNVPCLLPGRKNTLYARINFAAGQKNGQSLAPNGQPAQQVSSLALPYCLGEATGCRCRRSVSPVSVAGQCRRSVSTRPTRPGRPARLPCRPSANCRNLIPDAAYHLSDAQSATCLQIFPLPVRPPTRSFGDPEGHGRLVLGKPRGTRR